MDNRPRTKWGSLTMASAVEIREKFVAIGSWESSGDVDNMWIKLPVAPDR